MVWRAGVDESNARRSARFVVWWYGSVLLSADVVGVQPMMKGVQGTHTKGSRRQYVSKGWRGAVIFGATWRVVGGRANARLALALAANGGEDLTGSPAAAADKRALECGGLPSRGRRWLCWRWQ